MKQTLPAAVDARVAQLSDHLATIRRNMEQMMAENQRMREVVRIAESELRKRRDQVRQLEQELDSLKSGRREAKARVEHVMEQLDGLIAQGERARDDGRGDTGASL